MAVSRTLWSQGIRSYRRKEVSFEAVGGRAEWVVGRGGKRKTHLVRQGVSLAHLCDVGSRVEVVSVDEGYTQRLSDTETDGRLTVDARVWHGSFCQLKGG